MYRFFLIIYFLFMLSPLSAQSSGGSAYEKAELALQSGNYQEAVAYYNKAIEERPDFAEAYFHRGSAKFKLGDEEGALHDYNKALEIEGKNEEAYFNRAAVKNRMRDYEGALKDYTTIIEMDSANAEAYYNRSYVKFLLRFTRNGILDDLNQAISLEPE